TSATVVRPRELISCSIVRSETKKQVQMSASSPAQSSRAALLYSRIASSSASRARAAQFVDSATLVAASAVDSPVTCSVNIDAAATRTSQPAAPNLAWETRCSPSTLIENPTGPAHENEAARPVNAG